ncbi:MAG: hypothetical protein U5L75_03430 [Candidatus Campbellbacteria bacterium]|nr:hypothetical protein [Candidatus Campbellbacteria bacterium]
MDTKSVLYILLVVLVGLALIFVVSIFDGEESSTVDDKGSEEESEAPAEQTSTQDGWTHTATVNNMNITYYVVDEVDSEEGYTNEYDHEAEMCLIRLSEDYLEGTPPAVFGILGSLARCYGQAELGFPTGDFVADTNYINRFIREYIDRCDRQLEPLGFPVNDGQCEDMPRFEEEL